VTPPGEAKSIKKTMMEMGSNLVQSFHPINNFRLHLCGFAFYKDHPERQFELHRYCSSLNDEVTQCVLYDGDGSDARLIGIEYIISERLFNSLPIEEQKHWHSNAYDVLSGSLIAPRLPDTLEKPIMRDLVKSYGKTLLLWQVDQRDVLPLGEPQLMMVGTREGNQINPMLFENREKTTTLGYSTQHIVKSRQDITYPLVNPNADWGGYFQKPLVSRGTPTFAGTPTVGLTTEPTRPL